MDIRRVKMACAWVAWVACGVSLAGCGTRSERGLPFSVDRGDTVTIDIATAEVASVVGTALEMLADDMARVLHCTLHTGNRGDIVVGIDKQLLGGRKEAFTHKVDSGRLYITGSDAHGVAYGLLELSRLMGVSPWEWWADATPQPLNHFTLPTGYTCEQAPDVEYRGIFINDEDWGLMPWASLNYEQGSFGHIGPKTNARIFELLLRLRANTCWPAMHECTHPFFLTEGNREAARRYGIYIGGSHCEPMASSTAGEWPLRGEGEYDYVNNAARVLHFWEERVQDIADQPILYTIGMRGVHDGAMQGAKTIEQQREVLERVIKDQRKLLARHVNADVEQVPQVFVPYKEVLDIYNAGLQVPEDVCLMWCDDNYGYIRHFPTDEEQQRKGGHGIYYHVSYWGRPHDYLWLGTASPSLLYQQMATAYDKGIQRVWILNVGDIKPAEYQTELFMDMAWDMETVRKQGVERHLGAFLQREFGHEEGCQLLPVMKEHYRLAYIRKPEFLGGTRAEERDRKYWNTIRDLPWDEAYIDHRLAQYQAIADKVEHIAHQVAHEKGDTYLQLVKYPVQAAAEMNKKMLLAQKARHGLIPWEASRAAYDSIASLTAIYNNHNGGKWCHIMDAAPRRLPVFAPVPEKTTNAPMPTPVSYIYRWNGADCHKGECLHYAGLGYEGKAAGIARGSDIGFKFRAPRTADSIMVEVRLLPSHPIQGDRLRIGVSIDQSEPLIADYATRGRSEEWKENVLRNQAIGRFTLPVKRGRRHTLSIKAIDEGVVLDQVLVSEYNNSHK